MTRREIAPCGQPDTRTPRVAGPDLTGPQLTISNSGGHPTNLGAMHSRNSGRKRSQPGPVWWPNSLEDSNLSVIS